MRRIYIYQQSGWPRFSWEPDRLLPLLSSIRHKQGRLLGNLQALGFETAKTATLNSLTLEVLKTSEIEGEKLSDAQVRSSLARGLGLDIAGLVPSDRYVDGVVEMTLDATQKQWEQLTEERLFYWHKKLFPDGQSGMHKISTGSWRGPEAGPMQVVSGAYGKQKVHFEAPESEVLEAEMKIFISWFNDHNEPDLVIKSALAHLWFVTLHPFDDGNGRIARALAEMLLSRSDNDTRRFYSMSSQIRKERKEYYDILEKTQKGGMNVTEWMVWYLACLERALAESEKEFRKVLARTRFWDEHCHTELNERQRRVLSRLQDSFEGKLSTSKWAKICKCSGDTALRDINDLLEKNILVKLNSGGRSTAYELKESTLAV